MLEKLAPIQILLDGVDVTNCYWPAAGAIQITDPLNQPLTCGLSLSALRLPAQLRGGETLSIFDAEQLYFDGVVPVEAGVGTEFLYLDAQATPEVYRKMVKVTAADYQSVLDYVNQPSRIFYLQTAGSILRSMLESSILGPYINWDASEISEGYELPSYSITGRKFSKIAKELGQMNGFYFSIRTLSISPVRSFAVEFRTVSDRPAPFRIDRDAMKYRLNTLKFDPRDKPLVNKVTVVGGQQPSDDIQIDVFLVGPDEGRFALSRIPFYLQKSELMASNFSQDISDSPDLLTVGSAYAAGSLNNDELQINGSGELFFCSPFRFRDQRHITFEEITLSAGANAIFGVFDKTAGITVADVRLGVWFKPDGSISVIFGGVEETCAGNPTWEPRENMDEAAPHIYSIRLKQCEAGTLCEIQGGSLSPVRHWLPLGARGAQAEGTLEFTGTPSPGYLIVVSVGDLVLPPYRITENDASDPTLLKLHTSLITWLSGNAALAPNYWVSQDMDVWGIESMTSGVPVVVTVRENSHGLVSGERVWISDEDNLPSPIHGREFEVLVTGARTFELVGSDGTGMSPRQPYTGIVQRRYNRIRFLALTPGAQFNVPLSATIAGQIGTATRRQIEDAPRRLPPVAASTLAVEPSAISGGTDSGKNIGLLESALYGGISCASTQGTVHRMAVSDPIGVDVTLTRTVLARIAEPDRRHREELQDAQQTVSLTVGSGDERSEMYAAQILLEGNTAVLSFFADADCLPGDGDRLHVAYRYGVPIKVTVQDTTSIGLVQDRSQVPGDDGIREAEDLDVKDKIFSNESATRYGTQYLATRSGLNVQGSVETDSMITLGCTPRSGQALVFDLAAEALSRTEVVSQVTATHRGVLNVFDYSVAFGKMPEEFLMVPENPNIRNGPDVMTYEIRSVVEKLRLADEKIEFTVL